MEYEVLDGMDGMGQIDLDEDKELKRSELVKRNEEEEGRRGEEETLRQNAKLCRTGR